MRADNVTLWIPINTADRPVRLTTQARPHRSKMHYGVNLASSAGNVQKIQDNWRGHIDFGSKPTVFVAYVFDEYVVETGNGKVGRVIKYSSENGKANLILALDGIDVHEFKIEFIERNEIPAQYLAPEKLTEGLLHVTRAGINQEQYRDLLHGNN
jgi:hypothetical protein